MDRYVHYDSQISLLKFVSLFHRIFFKFFICRCTVAVLRKLQAKLEEVQLIYEREGSPSTDSTLFESSSFWLLKFCPY